MDQGRLANSASAVLCGLLVGAAALVGGAARSDVSAQVVMRWVPLTGDRPLGGHTAIVDGRPSMVLHGGERDGMQPAESMRQMGLDGPEGAWSDYRTTGTAPVPRLDGRGLPGSRAVLDPSENVAAIVCDCRNGSTHLLDLATGRWTRAPGDRALPLWYPLMAYDAANDRVVMYGGDEQGDAIVTSAGWSYDMSSARRGWQSLPDAPFRLVYQAAGFDDLSGHLVAFGGQDDWGGAVSDLWRLQVSRAQDQGAWRDVTPAAGHAPTARYGASLTFVPGTGTAVMYGGWAPGGDFADVWLLDYTRPDAPRWQLVADQSPAGLRAGHSAVWDERNRRIVLYGGVRGYDFLSDAWAIYLGPETATLTPTSPSASPTSSATATEPPTPSIPTPTATQTPANGLPSVFLPWSERS